MVIGYYYWKNTVECDHIKIDESQIALLRSTFDSAFTENRYKPYPYKEQHYPQIKEQKQVIKLQKFNPNEDNVQTLLQKGIPPYVAKNLVNYRSKGGVYKTKADIKKLYCIQDSLFLVLEPYIELEESQASLSTPEGYKVDSVFQKKWLPQLHSLNINQVSENELRTIPGIGAFFAKNIVEYRSELGGYVSINQINEAFGVSEEIVEKIEKYLYIDTSSIRKLSVNESDIKLLSQHPYLTYAEARAIVNYREQHGSIKSKKELKSLHIFKQRDISGLLPYLDLN